MSELICKHQDRMFDTASGILVSTCRCDKSLRLHEGVSKLVCDACQFREEPDAGDREVSRSLSEIFNIPELESRPLAERARILETYCFKCEHYDPEGKVCVACDCGVHVPVDEYAKYTAFHCSLEKW